MEVSPSARSLKIKKSGTATGPKETPSLKRKKSKVEEKSTEKPVLGKERKEAFDQEMLQKAWEKFKEVKKESGAGEMEVLVLDRKIEIISGSKVEISFNSTLEVSIFERIEIELAKFLRDELENDLISVEKKVLEGVKAAKLYTSHDKFDYMVKQNPSLKLLKEKLGLDFEF